MSNSIWRDDESGSSARRKTELAIWGKTGRFSLRDIFIAKLASSTNLVIGSIFRYQRAAMQFDPPNGLSEPSNCLERYILMLLSADVYG